ncbi:unnamed protein product [Rhizophagus irregularis]|nr:unnamed protein product [Rhizophagus irregularis]
MIKNSINFSRSNFKFLYSDFFLFRFLICFLSSSSIFDKASSYILLLCFLSSSIVCKRCNFSKFSFTTLLCSDNSIFC